jgi:hypothetical protein
MHSVSAAQFIPLARLAQVRVESQTGVGDWQSLSVQQFAVGTQLPSLHMWWVASHGYVQTWAEVHIRDVPLGPAGQSPSEQQPELAMQTLVPGQFLNMLLHVTPHIPPVQVAPPFAGTVHDTHPVPQ